jgi:hypothetical protein
MLNPMATSKNNFDAINFLKMLVTVVVGDHGCGVLFTVRLKFRGNPILLLTFVSGLLLTPI